MRVRTSTMYVGLLLGDMASAIYVGLLLLLGEKTHQYEGKRPASFIWAFQ